MRWGYGCCHSSRGIDAVAGVKAFLLRMGQWHYTQSTVQGQSSAIFHDDRQHRNKAAVRKALGGVTHPDTIPAEVAPKL